MLSLSADRTPTTTPELIEALQRGLQAQGLTPKKLEVTGDAFPALKDLRLDLSDAQLTRDFRPIRPQGENAATATFERVEILGQPVHFEGTPLDLHLHAQGATAGLYLQHGTGCVALENAASGQLALEISVVALEAALHRLAVEFGAKQGIEIKQTKLSFTQESASAVSFRIDVTAKVFIMSASIALTGKLEIDDTLNAHVFGLLLDGDAMIQKLVGGFAKPYIDRLEGRTISLASFTPAGLKVQGVELNAGPQLKLRATFAAA